MITAEELARDSGISLRSATIALALIGDIRPEDPEAEPLLPADVESQKAYDPNEPRDPATGQWIGTPGGAAVGHIPGLTAPGLAKGKPTDAEIEAGEDEDDQERMDRDEVDPGQTIPVHHVTDAISPVTGPVHQADAAGLDGWGQYLSKSGYKQIQQDARRGPSPTNMGENRVEALTGLIQKYGKSRKGQEGWRVTTLDHLTKAQRDKLESGKPITTTEKGFMSVGTGRIGSEIVGEATHRRDDLVELHMTIKTDAKALDNRQSPDPDFNSPDTVGELDYPPGIKLHFTGKRHLERRTMPLMDPSEGFIWENRAVWVYDVEVV